MKLYLVQHGEAAPEYVDPERPLTENGWDDVFKVAIFLKDRISVDIIWHSTKLRAKQTAELLSHDLLPAKGIVEKQGLAPNDPVKDIIDEISGSQSENLMIVGHLPFLARLASVLLGGSEPDSPVIFHQAGAVCLEQTGNGAWGVAWAVIPDLIEG